MESGRSRGRPRLGGHRRREATRAALAFVALEAVGKTHALEPIAPQVEALKPWLGLGGTARRRALRRRVADQDQRHERLQRLAELVELSFSRVTHKHPGRCGIFLNLAIALTLMEMNMFAALNKLLGFYSNVGIAWIAAVAADLVINARGPQVHRDQSGRTCTP